MTRRETIGGIDYYISSSEEHLETTAPSRGYLDTTSAQPRPPSLKDAISGLAIGLFENLGDHISSLNAPSEINVELSISFSEKLEAWVVGLQGDQKINLSITWKGGR
jgi:hypothetical protein